MPTTATLNRQPAGTLAQALAGTFDVASWMREAAQAHRLSAARPLSATDTAAKVPELASKPDPIEVLILALARAGIVTEAHQARLRASHARQKPTPADLRRRQFAAREAVASARTEGGEVGPDARALLDQWAAGQIDQEKMIQQIKARHGG
jgi:hypothetical protein